MDRQQEQVARLREMLDYSEASRNQLEKLVAEQAIQITKLTDQLKKAMAVFGDVGDPLR